MSMPQHWTAQDWLFPDDQPLPADEGIPSPEEDEELERVARTLLAADADGTRIGEVLRDTIDQLLDGQNTGRWDRSQLRKTEKTHMGTLVEINLHKEFDFRDGLRMDYEIDGIEVDCKFSQTFGGWMIPPEAVGHLCFLLWADDIKSQWSGGLVRIRAGDLGSGNRDGKKPLGRSGRDRVRWLWRDAELPENLLLHLSEGTRRHILEKRGGHGRDSGQARINELFRQVQGRIVRRAVVLTVAQQLDSLKRPRDARLPRHLGKEGILVLGHQDPDPKVARALGLPDTSKGNFVSVRVVPAQPDYPGPSFGLDGARWRVADPDDPVVPAPSLPRKGAAIEI
jgi:hypothetical protein